ncbi:OLC1v1005386C1 [Oldenlandia corymbosa var. corymbosa]|uniref:OLC1v1005386C1 n=1 Tax=Oldenlandia corymbosa var. corymbosa TaxID=529605 RepID=A0AAV1DEQ2_OLDCO|nr:OLC1v1005386C1 [Oldenlandia corymbosa var. corymbosa]
MVDRIKRLRKELRKLKDGISPLQGSGHRHAVTRNLYAEHRAEKEKKLKKVKNVHPTFGPVGESANVDDDDDDFEGEDSAEDSFESGRDDVAEEDDTSSFSSHERRDIRIGDTSVLNPIGCTVDQTLSTLYRGQSTTLQHASSSGTSRRSKVSTEEIDDWVVTDDVPGGPCDGSVIPSFLGHTAYQLWNGEPRDYLTIKPAKSLSRLHGWYARLSENAQLQIQQTGEILKMQVAGLLGMSLAELKRAWSHGGVSDILIEECCRRVLPAVQVQAWVWILLASTLFLDRRGGRISASLMTELHRGIGNIGEYSWGSGTLAFLYRQLGIASRAGCTTMAGCMTLLQAWIYEYFPCFQPSKRRGRRGVVGWPRARDWTPVSYVTDSFSSP